MELDSTTKPDPICEPCLSGKMHAHPFPSSQNCSSSLLELIHSDVKSALPRSSSGFIYWVTFIDDFSLDFVLSIHSGARMESLKLSRTSKLMQRTTLDAKSRISVITREVNI